MAKHYDIIINGGGIVGFTLLNLIKKSPQLNRFKILLIEQSTKPTQDVYNLPRYLKKSIGETGEDNDVNFSNRVSSISPKSRDIFMKLGVWQNIDQYTKSVRDIQVWNYNPNQRLVFKRDIYSTNQIRDHQCGLFDVVENNRLSSSLLECIEIHGENAILWEHNLLDFKVSNDRPGAINLTVRNKISNEELDVTGSLLLGCDGYKSKVRTVAGIEYREQDLKKRAVVGTVKMSYIHMTNEVAYQRFSNEKDTVAALLPLDENYSSFVISGPEDYTSRLLSLSNEAFVDEFNDLLTKIEYPSDSFIKTMHDCFDTTMRQMGYIFKNLTLSNDMQYDTVCIESLIEGSRASFPLFFGTTSPKMIARLPCQKYAQIALLGDSAHRIHPLAGQGLNLGLEDAHVLVEGLEKVVRYGDNPFNLHDLSTLENILKRYECSRQFSLIPMSYGIMAMPNLFKILPSSVVSLVNNCTPLKDASVKFASGSNTKYNI